MNFITKKITGIALGAIGAITLTTVVGMISKETFKEKEVWKNKQEEKEETKEEEKKIDIDDSDVNID